MPDADVLVEAVLVVVPIDKRYAYERQFERLHQLSVGLLAPVMRLRTVLAGSLPDAKVLASVACAQVSKNALSGWGE